MVHMQGIWSVQDKLLQGIEDEGMAGILPLVYYTLSNQEEQDFVWGQMILRCNCLSQEQAGIHSSVYNY